MPTIINAIKNLSKDVPLGSSRYFTCPVCYGKNKLGITKSYEGIVYNCFRSSCKTKGKLNNSFNKETLSSIINSKFISTKRNFILPDHLINGFANEAALKFGLKYNLLKAYSKKIFKTSTDIRLNRQVFYYTNSLGDVVGAMGRALSTGISKAYIYPDSLKTPYVIGTTTKAVVVEDILSAFNVYNSGFTGIALSGTTMSLDYVEMLKDYETVIIALDKDASIKAIELKKLIDFYCNNVIILLLDKDIKDMTIEEAQATIMKAL